MRRIVASLVIGLLLGLVITGLGELADGVGGTEQVINGWDPGSSVVMKSDTVAPSGVAPTNFVVFHQAKGTFNITVKIDNTPINVLVDTGATNVALTPEDATKVHDAITLKGDPVYISMAVGTSKVLPIVIRSITIGGIELRDVDGWILSDGAKSSLLGMTFLRRIGRLQISGDTLTLMQ
jgi:aspartyl protease family protein